MALESPVNTIYDLVATNPTGGDSKSTLDDHLRAIKTGVLASFAYGSSAAGYYQKIGKYIVQFGTVTTSATPGVATTITLPTPFLTASRIVGAFNNTSSAAGITVFAGAATTTTLQVAASVASLGVSWVAIGE